MSAPWERRPVANDEHLALLRQGTAVWNQWRERNPDVVPDLEAADLSGADLSGADLRRANLCIACLYDTNLIRADLSGADLHQAYLSGADLSWADLVRAKLIRADLIRADLSGADLRGADLSGAFIGETIFGDIDLTESKGLDECQHFGPSTIDFRTLSRSENSPITFLRGCGLPDHLIEYLPSLCGNAIKFYSCFISYSAKDQVFADRLHADLQNKGVRCWFAPHDLPTGAKILDAIDEAIRLRDKLLLILSEASIASEWVETK